VRRGERSIVYGTVMGKPEEQKTLAILGVDNRIKLK
jgi:hypothetical protein